MNEPSQEQVELGKRIRRLRRDRDWSQEHLAELAGSHYVSISRYERAETAPRIESLRGIAAAFGMNLGDLLNGEQS